MAADSNARTGSFTLPARVARAALQVIQILPEHLKYRAAYNPPLKSLAQLSPSFFDAPGARQVRLALTLTGLQRTPPCA
jgi:hypothetical protein